MDQLIHLDTIYWARIKAPDGYPTYLMLWVDCVSRSMSDQYPILHTTMINGHGKSFYYKGYVPPEDIPRELSWCTVLDLEPLDHHCGTITSPNIRGARAEFHDIDDIIPCSRPCSRQKEHAPTIDAAALQEFL